NGIAGGKHENRRAETGETKLAAYGAAVLDGQHEIENDQVVWIDGSLIESLPAIDSDIDGVSLFTQALGDKAGHARFIFHQQNAHAFIVRLFRRLFRFTTITVISI